MGRGEKVKRPCTFSLPHHPPSALLACLQLSRTSSPLNLTLGKPLEEAVSEGDNWKVDAKQILKWDVILNGNVPQSRLRVFLPTDAWKKYSRTRFVHRWKNRLRSRRRKDGQTFAIWIKKKIIGEIPMHKENRIIHITMYVDKIRNVK